MNREMLKGHWNEVKGKIKQQWGKLTDDDLTQMRGSYEELQGKLQKLYGYEQERAKREIDSFIEKQNWKERTE